MIRAILITALLALGATAWAADGEVKMLPTTAPSAKPKPTVPQNAG